MSVTLNWWLFFDVGDRNSQKSFTKISKLLSQYFQHVSPTSQSLNRLGGSWECKAMIHGSWNRMNLLYLITPFWYEIELTSTVNYIILRLELECKPKSIIQTGEIDFIFYVFRLKQMNWSGRGFTFISNCHMMDRVKEQPSLLPQ